MKQYPIVLGALAISGSVWAQSSVTISGFVDLGIGRSIGSSVNAMQEAAVGNSRIAFRGVEDLGGGYGAMFGMEHRFRPDLGTEAVAGRFWAGYSTVGLRTPMGSVNLGRQYTASYSLAQAQFDPFGNVTVANLRDIGMRPGAAIQGLANTPAGVATVSKVRVSDSIRYDYGANGFNFAASVGEAAQDSGVGPDRPWSVAANYKTGNLFLAAAYEDPQFASDHLWNYGAKYTLGSATLSLGGASGRTANNLKVSGILVGLSYAVGSGSIRVGMGRSKIGDGAGAVERQRYGLGYLHNLSKRTRIYTNLAHDTKVANNSSGFDLGLIVSF